MAAGITSKSSTSKSISICHHPNILFTSKSSYVLLRNPTDKTETRTGNRRGTNNSKPPGPIIMMRQLETLSSSQIIFITLFLAGAQRCCTFYQLQQPAQLCRAKTIFLSQISIRWIFFIQIYCGGSHTEHHRRCSKLT